MEFLRWLVLCLGYFKYILVIAVWHAVKLVSSDCLGTCGFVYLDQTNIITGKQPRFRKCTLNVQGVVCVCVYTSIHM